MRFIGNKENLIAKIYGFMCECGVVDFSVLAKSTKPLHSGNPQRIFDMFSGSASAGRFFKTQGFEVTSCDLLYFSYCLQMAYLANNNAPSFSGLSEILREVKTQNLLNPTPYQKIIALLNALDSKKGFIYHNYAPSGSKANNAPQPRMYFSDENAQKIDAIRAQIQAWKEEGKITQNEYFILLATLLESLSLFANVAGVYAAFCKVWDKRALKPFALKEIALLRSQVEHFCFCGNCLEILANHNGTPFDILYLDPPYNHRQYAPNYHLLETIAKYDSPRISGVAGLRAWQEAKSNFCSAKLAPLELGKIAQSPHYKALVLSYNSEGIMSKEQIEGILRAQQGRLDFAEFDYPRFHSQAKSTQIKRGKKTIKEYVWILQR